MSKLSEELAQFSKDLAKLPPADREKVYAAIRASFGPIKSTRKTSTGESVDTRDVDFTVIDAAVPPDLRQDWRQIQRDMNEAARRHGNQWADESFAYMLAKRVLPQPSSGEQLVASVPGLVEAIAARLPMSAPADPPKFTLSDDIIAQLEKAGFKREQPSA